jgi:hypothetical protein
MSPHALSGHAYSSSGHGFLSLTQTYAFGGGVVGSGVGVGPGGPGQSSHGMHKPKQKHHSQGQHTFRPLISLVREHKFIDSQDPGST